MRKLMFLAALLIGCGDKAANEPQIDSTSVEISAHRGSSAVHFQVVDNGSPFMRKLAAHVGDAKGLSDPAALAAGITAERDYWTVERAAPQRDDFLQARDRGGVKGRALIATYLAELAKRDASFRVPDDRQLAYRETSPGTWRSYYLERAVDLTGAEIAPATPKLDSDDRAIVAVDFTTYGQRVFGDLTSRAVGKKLAIVVGEIVEYAPVVQDAVRGGKMTITMRAEDTGTHDRDAQQFASMLNGH